jgi:Jacalin-like lectin domain.
VRSGAFVDSIEFWGIDASGKEFSLGEHCGGVGGGCNDVTLRADEFIMGFSGHNGRILDQITIKTNKGKYGPYGGVNGARPFTIHLECPLRVWKAHARGHGKDFVVEWFHCGDGLNEIQEIVPN